MLDNWAEQELPQLGPNSACFLPDGNGFINRVLNVVDQPIMLPPVCWESCLPCGAVLGCTDPTSPNFNPWANIDDGSCVTIPSCPSGQTPIAIVVIPDNYGGELSWKLYGDSGLVTEAPTGTYSGAQPGLPISTFVCVDTNQLYDLVDANNCDYETVLKAMLYDDRIAFGHTQVADKEYSNSEPRKRGFGGACLPKDVNAIYHFSNKKFTLLKEIQKINKKYRKNYPTDKREINNNIKFD